MSNDHLEVTRSERGFARLPEIPGGHGGNVAAYESSAASGPHVWLRVVENGGGAATAHLTAENAWRLADQLRALVRDHYQGDATPDWAQD